MSDWTSQETQIPWAELRSHAIVPNSIPMEFIARHKTKSECALFMVTHGLKVASAESRGRSCVVKVPKLKFKMERSFAQQFPHAGGKGARTVFPLSLWEKLQVEAFFFALYMQRGVETTVWVRLYDDDFSSCRMLRYSCKAADIHSPNIRFSFFFCLSIVDGGGRNTNANLSYELKKVLARDVIRR